MKRGYLLLFVSGISACVSAAGDNLRTAALSGGEALDAGPGVYFARTLHVPPLGSGRVAFGASLDGPGIIHTGALRNDYALWSESSQGIRKVVQSGDMAPGEGAQVVLRGGIRFVSPEQAGAKFVSAEFVENFRNRGVWHRSLDGELDLVALSGNPSPAPPNVIVRMNPPSPVANGRDQIAFPARYFGPGIDSNFNSAVILRDADGQTRAVARAGDPVPGMPAYVFQGGFENLQLSDSQRLVFTAQIRESPVQVGDFRRLDALLSADGAGTLSVIAVEGQPAPGAADDATFDGFSSPLGRLTLNRAGTMAFFATLSGGGNGLWTDRSGDGLTLIASRDGTAPGLDVDHRLYGIGNVTINGQDEVAFSANYFSTGGSGGNGVWIERQGRLQLVARTGDALPGLPLDTVFDFGWIFQSSERQVAVLNGSLTRAGVDDDSIFGIWAYNLAGDLLPVAQEGDLLDISDDPRVPDLRRISSLQAGQIDDAGYISFTASFDDGTSGVFVSSAVAIPEPAGGPLLVAALILPLLQRASRSAQRQEGLAVRRRAHQEFITDSYRNAVE